jgi:pantoate--beta-alanine ligase
LLPLHVFVNPTQFGPSEDLAHYPRTPERDAALLAAEGADVLFMPSAEEMYPPGFGARVEVGRIGEVLEGASRPGHLAGVATVVLKLFQLVRPTRADFGQKDAQQLAVIRQMVRDLNLPVEIVAGPTMREPDGLAMSSRNAYLSPAERRAATVLYHALTAARERYNAGERAAEALRHVMHKTVSAEPLARLDYAEVVNADTMEPPAMVEAGALLVIAARIGTTRLIDSMALD